MWVLIKGLLKDVLKERDFSDDTLLLAKAAKVVLYGSEAARIIAQFEEEYFSDDDLDDAKNFANRETGKASQRLLHRQIRSLVDVIQSMGNPFLNDFLSCSIGL